jgi:hypothetical protein
MATLQELGKKYGTDKHNVVNFPPGNDLVSFYADLLKGRNVSKMLEIGIGHAIPGLDGCMGISGYKFGASLSMWEEFFPNASIYALDIVREILVNRGRIHSFWCDQSDEKSIKSVMPMLGKDFDFIEDDGSHQPAHQALTANLLLPLLAPGGVYVIEDVWLSHRDFVKNGIPYESEWHECIDTVGGIGNLQLVIKR